MTPVVNIFANTDATKVQIAYQEIHLLLFYFVFYFFI